MSQESCFRKKILVPVVQQLCVVLETKPRASHVLSKSSSLSYISGLGILKNITKITLKYFFQIRAKGNKLRAYY